MRYKFREVLVADTRRLWPNQPISSGPQILVLNERLNECQELGKSCNSLAATCCVHVERPEFARRRKRSDAGFGDCFASCAKRRPVDIELTPVERAPHGGDGKLGGKLVILGDGDRKRPEYRCERTLSWWFGHFKPSGSWQARRNHNQTFYVRLDHFSKSNQKEEEEDSDDNDNDHRWPPLQVDQLNITWDASNGRELISMLVVRPSSSFVSNEIANLRKETLVSTELVCRNSNNNTDKIHLLTLVNRRPRQVPPHLNFRPPDATTNSSSKVNASKRGIVSQLATQITSNPTTGKAPATAQHPVKQRGAWAASFLWAELLVDKLRAQLTQSTSSLQISDGLLHLALGSLVVILIYAMCLLCLYLRGCRRRRRRRLTTTMQMKQATKPRSCNDLKQPKLNVSKPFNLQMPPATKTRLEMMMGVSVRTKSKRRGREVSSLDKGKMTRVLPSPSPPPPPTNLQRRPSAKRMVRAIRQAATNRFSRRGRHRCGPRELLNVIPESSECSSPSVSSNGLGKSQASSAAHFDELVQQAMSLQCAHLKFNEEPSKLNKPRHRQQTRTLFSKRLRRHQLALNDNTRTTVVSRNRILKQMKQDNLYE